MNSTVADLTGLTAVVTGGNQGIGLALATGIGRAGAQIAIWARNADRNAAALAELSDLGVTAWSVSCDVTDEDDVSSAMARTVERFGRLGCMVANAGVADSAPFIDTSLGEWHRIIRTNLDGSFLCTREAAREFVQDGQGGSIIVVSSTISRYGGAKQPGYAVSKTGLIGLGRTLAVELAPHRVRCNILVPGWTATAMNAELQADDRFMRVTRGRTPVRRWAAPEEFHEVGAFLADPRQTFHTGNEVVVDGGYTVF